MTQKCVKFIKNENNLVIKLLPEGKTLIQNCKRAGVNIDSDTFFEDLVEWQLCNGWEKLRPEDIGALTDAPIFSESGEDKVYWFPNYQIESPVQILLEKGEVTFTGVRSEC
jgi:hypothetical protein